MKKVWLFLMLFIVSFSTSYACGLSEQLHSKVGVANKFQAQVIANDYNIASFNEPVNTIKTVEVCENNELYYTFNGIMPLHMIVSNSDIAKISVEICTDVEEAKDALIQRKFLEMIYALHYNNVPDTMNNEIFNALDEVCEKDYAIFHSDINNKTYVLRIARFKDISHLIIGAI